MIEIHPYRPELKGLWNEFVLKSKNGTFMLGRDYMDYHADRFEDFSLMCYAGEELRAVLPASRHGNEIRSHGGLTYGGLVCGLDMTIPLILDCFQALRTYLAERGLTRLLYKRIPYIYYRYPADEDLYALFIHDARLVRRDISSCILQRGLLGYNEKRLRNLRSQSRRRGLEVRENQDYETYMDLMASVLRERHQTRPTHTAAEITQLAERHPDHIRLFSVFRGREMLAGALMYETPLVAHTQYLANSPEGRMVGALDLVIDHLVNERYRDKTYFDFGISTEQDGRALNKGLDFQKGKFGGRGVTYDVYELLAASPVTAES